MIQNLIISIIKPRIQGRLLEYIKVGISKCIRIILTLLISLLTYSWNLPSFISMSIDLIVYISLVEYEGYIVRNFISKYDHEIKLFLSYMENNLTEDMIIRYICISQRILYLFLIMMTFFININVYVMRNIFIKSYVIFELSELFINRKELYHRFIGKHYSKQLPKTHQYDPIIIMDDYSSIKKSSIEPNSVKSSDKKDSSMILKDPKDKNQKDRDTSKDIDLRINNIKNSNIMTFEWSADNIIDDYDGKNII